MSKKKILIFSLIALDVIITVFLFVLSILVILKTQTTTTAEIINTASKSMISYLCLNNGIYLGTCVIPLFVLLLLDIIGLLYYVKKKGSKKENVTVNDLTDEQKEELRRGLLEDLHHSK